MLAVLVLSSHYGRFTVYVCAKSLQMCPALCDPIDHSLTGSSVHGIHQARILEWVAMASSGDLPNPKIELASLTSPALAGGFFTPSATWEALWKAQWKPCQNLAYTLGEPRLMTVPRMIMATGTSHPASGIAPSRQIQPSESY